MPNTRPLDRRTVLRGAGGLALSLPLLEAMLPRRASAATPPRRFLVWSTPNGTVIDRWICPVGASDSDFTLSEILAPLERHKADMIGLQNLQQYGGHAHHWAASLTGRPFKDTGYPGIAARGISLDQHIAQRWARQTPVPSLQIGTNVTDGRDSISAVSWAAAEIALPAENNPFALFGRLFGTGANTAGQAFSARRSALDSVLSQARALSQRLGQSDRPVLENYLESVRSAETQISALEQKASTCRAPAIGADPTQAGARPWWLQNANVPAIMKLQMDLIAAIFACDLTRVITYTVSNAGGYYRVPDWVEGTMKGRDWHALSHAVEQGIEAPMVACERWHYQQLAYLLDRLKAYDEGGRSLLWSTLLFANDEYGPNGPVKYVDPARTQTHNARVLPYLVFGQAGGTLRTGRWLAYPVKKDATGVHHTQLLVGMLNALGIPDQSFGDPAAMQGPLPRLLG